MQNSFLSLLMGGGLILMPYMRTAGMLGVLFGLVVGAWSGSFLVFLTFEIGCLDKTSFVKD